MKNLRLLFFACFLGCFLPVLAYAQGVYLPARTVFGTVNGITRPIAGATITVCAANTAGIPCSPALANTVFKDQGLTVPLSNPFTADANGNYPQAALAGGTYTITESAVGFAGFSAQVTVTCGPGAPCTIGPFTATSATITGALSACFINNTCMADCQPGPDACSKISACFTACPSTGCYVDATGFQGAQACNSDILLGMHKPATVLFGPLTLTLNAKLSPDNPNVRFLGIGGSGGNGGGSGTGNTTFSVGFATGDVFTPTANGSSFELGNMNIVAGVTRTSGFLLNPAPGANAGYVHDLHIQNQYGTFKLFAGGGVGINNWRFNNITWNCGSSSLHTGEFISLGSTDITVTSSAHIFHNFSSTGDICIHDVAAIHNGSKTDSPEYSDWNFGISRSNTSTVPNWLFDNTIAGATTTSQPRLVHGMNIMSEGDGLAGNDIFSGSACTDCEFSHLDLGGGDHAVNLSGGNGWHFALSQFANNRCGGIYVTTGAAHIGLSIISNNFYGNNVSGGTCYDIQPAAGTSDMDVYSNKFGQIPSTVTGNNTTQPINVPGTTSGPFNIAGNQMNQAVYTNTGLVTDYTSFCGFSETEDGRTRFHRGCGSGSSRDIYLAGNAQNCWQIGSSEITANALGFAPSTAACTFGGGFPTFSRDVISMSPTGTVTFNGSSTPTISLVNGAGTGTTNFTAFGGAVTTTGQPAIIPCNTSQKSESAADANVLTCSIPAVAASYRLRFDLSLSAANTATLGWTATWTDSNGTAQAPTNLPICISSAGTCAATTGALSSTVTASGDYHIDVNNAGTSIVIKLTFSGTSFTGKVSATVERLI